MTSELDNELIPPILLFLPIKLEYVTNTRSDYELTLSLESFKNQFFPEQSVQFI